MEIYTHAERKPTDGEIVGWNEDSDAVRDEACKRGLKAGYCARHGEPAQTKKPMMFVSWGRSKLNVWPRDADGNLIE